MATEKAFALFHTGFWNRTIPLAGAVVRQISAGAERFCEPLESASLGDRGLINECGFRTFAAAVRLGVPAAALPPQRAQQASDDALAFISRFREHSRSSIAPLTAAGLTEAQEIARRIQWFLAYLVSEGHVSAQNADHVFPHFRGCGWVDACDGDLLHSGILCELKAGARGFVARDIRQVLVYLALNSASHQYDIHSVCLCNPRRGTLALMDVEPLCQSMSGLSRGELLSDIVAYMSEGRWRPEPVG